MKKVVFILLLFFSFICFSSAKEITLTNKIIEIEEIKGFGLQGFTTTDEHLFAILIGDNDSKSIIKVFDLNTHAEVKEIRGSTLGHANDVTFNKNINKIYILASSGSTQMFEFDANDFSYIRTIDINVPARSITYIEDIDKYAVRLVTSGFLLDSSFNVQKIPFILGMNADYDVGRQGWAYYDKLIYYANWSWVRRGGDGNNTIFIYDLKGNKVDEFLTDDETGEIEDIAFYKDKMILGFNGYDHKIKFYMEDIPKVDKEYKVPVDEIIVEDIPIEENNSFLLWFFIPIIFIFGIIYLIRKKTSK